MALSALTRTYHAHANLQFPDTSTTALIGKSFWFCLKALLANSSGLGGTQSGTRPAGSVWTHAASCDGVSVSTVTDLWPDAFDGTKLVPNTSGSAHSWWRGTNGTHDIVLDMNSATAGSGRISIAPTGTYSAGTTTAGPTSSTAFMAGNTGADAAGTVVAFYSDTAATGVIARAHLVTNEDDHAFQFHTSKNGAGLFNSFLAMQITSNANDSYNRFFFNHVVTTGRGAPQMATLTSPNNSVGRTHGNAGNKTGGGAVALSAGGTALAGASGIDAVTGNYHADPVEVRDLTTGYIAKRGFIPDWRVVGAPAVGGSVPSAAAQERVIVGDFVMPFPSVVPTL